MAFPLIPALMALSEVVPAISRWVGGSNAEPIAEKIADVAKTVAGSSDLKEAIERIRVEPEKRQAFTLAMEQNSADLEKAYLVDRQSARERDTKIQIATGRNKRGDLLAAGAVVGFFACLGVLFFGPEIASGERDLIMVMIGTLLGILKDVYGFEFGSSKDSARLQEHFKNGNGKG